MLPFFPINVTSYDVKLSAFHVHGCRKQIGMIICGIFSRCFGKHPLSYAEPE
jgi:hypothetical protein